MRDLMRGAVRIGLGIAIAIGLVAVAANIYDHFQDSDRRAAEAALDVAKLWEPIAVGIPDRVTGTLTTKWRDGNALYRLDVAPYPKSWEVPSFDGGTTIDQRHSFTVRLLDSDGFAIASEEVQPGKITRIVNEKNEATALTSDGAIGMASDTYEKVSSWELQWR